MATTHTKIRQIRFVIEDELTQAYVFVDAWNDVPLGVQGWHHKTFPASKPIDAIITELAKDHLLWSQEAPTIPAVPSRETSEPAEWACFECGPAIRFTSASAMHFDMYGHTPTKLTREPAGPETQT